jgi:hypothetical protein
MEHEDWTDDKICIIPPNYGQFETVSALQLALNNHFALELAQALDLLWNSLVY